jgi:DNA-binding PadR family transcriptional regulator
MTSHKVSTLSTDFEKGHLKMLILMLLNQKCLHGYEIMNEIEERTLGLWRPTAGGIYPILKRMERDCFVEGTWKVQDRRRKIYKITPKGREVFKKILERHKIIEETKRQLNSDLFGIPAPKIPKHPFSEVLSYRADRAVNNKKKVEHLSIMKTNLEEMIKKMQSLLERVNRKLAYFEKVYGFKPERKTKN